MSMLSSSTVDLLLLLLLLCHSMHACEGRRLGGSVNKDGRKHHVHHSINKDVETILEKTLISSKKNPCSSKELSMRKQRVTDDQNQVGTSTTATTNAQKMIKNSQKAMANDEVDQEKKRIPNNPGNEFVMFSDVGFQQSTKIEESERRGRSLLGSESHDSEETIDSKKDDDVEDVGVMDYQQPRRKPPIHNFSP